MSTPNAPIPDWARVAANETLRMEHFVSDVHTMEVAQVIANHHASATQTLTCVYCGHEYPPGTPAHGSSVLTDHIRVCTKHPMTKVRNALAALVGASTKEELEAMEGAIRLMPAPAADKVTILDAIHVLIETAP